MDSGASMTVIQDEMAKAVSASNADPSMHCKLADGSTIPHGGHKPFLGVTNEGWNRNLKASVTYVDRPLLSVAQITQHGGRVVFDKNGSYIDGPNGQQRIHLEQRGGLHHMKMWIHGIRRLFKGRPE